MLGKDKSRLREASPYTANITREGLLAYEMRTTAELVCAGLSQLEIKERVFKENLYQYPTEKKLRSIANVCLHRIDAINSEPLVEALATQTGNVVRQISLYAMMRYERIVWDFMITVVGAKYRTFDFSFRAADARAFMTGLQEQDDWVASWADSTIVRVRQVLVTNLVRTGYIDRHNSTRLNPIIIDPTLEKAIRVAGLEVALPAFNCIY